MTHVGVSSLRVFTAKKLASMTDVCVVHCHSQPIAALVPYQLYMSMLQVIKAMDEAASRKERDTP